MEFDFLVVGAGMAGVSLADALALSSRVALLEAEQQPGYHATARSAALFVPSYGTATFRALARASGPFLRAPPPEYFPQSLLRSRGALHIARSDQRAEFAATVEELRSGGAQVEVLTADEACLRVPLLRRTYVSDAAFEAEVADIDVAALLQGFLRRAKAHGVHVILGARLGPVRRSTHGWQLEVSGEVLDARVLVNAAGAWADEVGIACGASPLGLHALRRTAALIDAPPGVAVGGWPALFDVGEQFYLKPETGRLLISPADEEPATPGDAYPEDLAVAVAVDRIQQALDIDVRRVAHQWAGLRTFAPDRDPVVGFDPRVENLFWCAGQGGCGIESAPALSRLAAALARGEAIPTDITAQGVSAQAVSPARFRHCAEPSASRVTAAGSACPS
jgi:D-arginine dehydrogenase